MSSEEKAIEEFISITGIAKSVAEQYLSRNEYDVELAVNDYYNVEHVEPGSRPNANLTGNRPSPPKSSGPVFKSFSDLQHGNDNGANDNDDNDDDMNFFTGGQKSGLAVEDPNKKKSGNGRKLVDDLLEKAEKEAAEPDWRDNDNTDEEKDVKKMKTFQGTGHSLGSIGNAVDSRTILGENSSRGGSRPEKVTRVITFWKEGFSIDDGELYKYDDPKNQEYLKQLNMGRAPLSLLNVQMFQDVDVSVIKKLEESYHDHQKAKPRIYGFEGEGQRLGSPIPGEPTTVEEALEKYGVTGDSAENVEITEEPEVAKEDEVEGDTSIQIRLATGERLVRKFNSSDKVETIYEYVASNGDSSRPWGLVTSFPTQPLDDKKDETIAGAGLKNAVIIQRWK